ncbi:MAG: histidine kinase [Kordiimonadaceae bacterium]|nr:histidine kinase [Kordiimonadaceae bacterium]MBO6567541.1 histidine kinase [Kordiimonadaceae bacterium]MBO6963245.1 histidine kinase [Kordiimonadaceae bacterium]
MLDRGLPPDLMQRFVIHSVSAVFSVGAGVFMFVFLQSKKPMRWTAVFALAVLTLLLHALIAASTYSVFPAFPSRPSVPFYWLFNTAVLYSSPIVSSAFIGFIAIHFGQQLSEQQRLFLEKSNAARDAQLAVLRHQLNPHFLFNTLNSISALVTEDDKKNAEKTILLLSEFLRFSLESDVIDLIPLEEELAIANKYLQIEKVRYEDRLNVVTHIDEAARNWLVPPFLLQPLLENVIKHAVSKVNRPVNVSVNCIVSDSGLRVTVEDDGPGVSGESEPSAGTGHRNLSSRLNLIYGSHAKMEIKACRPKGLRVSAKIPNSYIADRKSKVA